VKKLLFVTMLVVALASLVVAQDSRMPQASLDRETGIISHPHVGQTVPAPGAPKFCKPCLFYAGDFDSNASDANGLANEVDVAVSQAGTYAPFKVPSGATWTVTGLLGTNFMSQATLSPTTSPYEVRKGIKEGSGGKLLCHGTKKNKVTDTGLNDFGFEVFAVAVPVKNCKLTKGTYWQDVVPYCTDTNTCSSFRSFLTNDDGAMAHKVGGTEPANDSFFNSTYFGATWDTTQNQQSSSRFTIGVEGTK